MNFTTFRNFFGWTALLMLLGALAACNSGKTGDDSLVHPGDMVLGSNKAPITIVEYASLTCPHCAEFDEDVFPELQSKYVDTGKVRYIYRQMPSPPQRLAIGAEAIARCKGDAKDYYKMLGVLYAKQRSWMMAPNPGTALRNIALSAGISSAEFDKCVSDPAVTQYIQKENDEAVKKWNLQTVPQFIINDKHYPDLHSLASFQKIIDPMLDKPAGADK